MVNTSRTVLNNSSGNRCPCHVSDVNENAFMDLIVNTVVAFGLREIEKLMLGKYSIILILMCAFVIHFLNRYLLCF